MKIMKKFLLSMSLMFGALTLTSCAKDAAEENILPNDGKGFSFVAEIDNTRATVDGMKTVWEAGDQVGFGGVKEDNTFATCRLYGFDYADGKFSNAKSTFTAANQFYAVWPTSLESGAYTEVYTTANTDETKPAHRTAQYYNVGYSKTGVVQNGASAAHIPAVAPMYWMSEGTIAPEALAVKFHHTTALMKFTVKNTEDAAIKVASLRFGVPTDTKISGTYYINLTNGELTPSGTAYAYNYAVVDVENAPEIAKDETFDVYMAVAPFALQANDAISILVTTADGATCTVTENVAKELTFAAGTYNTKTIEFKKDVVVAEEWTVDQLSAAIEGGAASFSGKTVKGYVAAIAADGANSFSNGTLLITSNSCQKGSTINFYDNGGVTNRAVDAEGLFIGAEVIITLDNASVSSYNGVSQIAGVKDEDVEIQSDKVNEIVAKVLTIADYAANYKDYANMYLAFENVEPVQAYDKATGNMSFTDGTNTLPVYNNARWTAGASVKIGKQKGTLYGFGTSYTDKNTKKTTAQLCNNQVKELAAFAPSCTLSDDSLTFAANNGTAGNAPESQVVTATFGAGCSFGTITTDAAWLSALAAEDGIVIAAQENTGNERTATITVNVMKDGAITDVKTISVTQKKAGAAMEQTVTSDANFCGGTATETALNSDNSDIVYYVGGASSANTYTGTARFYKGTTLNIKGNNGAEITKLVFNVNSYKSEYVTLLQTALNSVSGATVTVEGSVVTATFATAQSAIAISFTGGQVRVDSLEVTYTK